MKLQFFFSMKNFEKLWSVCYIPSNGKLYVLVSLYLRRCVGSIKLQTKKDALKVYSAVGELAKREAILYKNVIEIS